MGWAGRIEFGWGWDNGGLEADGARKRREA
jgi:hypothetical protein